MRSWRRLPIRWTPCVRPWPSSRVPPNSTPRGTPPLALKIGVHAGPSIAVTLNERLDYLGSTANLAARLQAIAGPGEVVVSAAMANDPTIGELVAPITTEFASVRLRGFDEPVACLRLSPMAAGSMRLSPPARWEPHRFARDTWAPRLLSPIIQDLAQPRPASQMARHLTQPSELQADDRDRAAVRGRCQPCARSGHQLALQGARDLPARADQQRVRRVRQASLPVA